jgi:hypothetical protein
MEFCQILNLQYAAHRVQAASLAALSHRRPIAHEVPLRSSGDAGGVVRKIAIIITVTTTTALATLATGLVSAEHAPSAPLSPSLTAPGITVTDQGSLHGDSADMTIAFSKTLRILLTVNSTANVSKCTAPSPSYEWVKLELVDPSGKKSDLGSLDNADLFGGEDCSGRHSKTKSFDVAGAKGNYLVILLIKTLVNRRPKSGPYFVYPSVRIEADGTAALERSYPSYGDEAQITQVVPLLFK